ncbi:hypothetical protein Mapa_002166 [Marchantia paleacea]|nr:hypothetical protein Mapa_002166 [Marchantia paleacea]
MDRTMSSTIATSPATMYGSGESAPDTHPASPALVAPSLPQPIMPPELTSPSVCKYRSNLGTAKLQGAKKLG